MSRKIDALVAEKVMGFSVTREYAFPAWSVPPESPLFRKWDGEYVSNGAPPFSTDIAAVWSVVEKFGYTIHTCDMGVKVELFNEPGKGPSRRVGESLESSAPIAICLAALRAVGVPETEILAAMEGA